MNAFELLLYVLAALSACAILVASRRCWPYRAGFVVLATLLVSAVLGFSWQPSFDYQLENYLPQQARRDGFMSSRSCRSCHPKYYSSWHDTFHRTMTQIAGPESVLAPFDDIELVARGREYRLFRRGSEYWVNMPDLEWEKAMQDRGADLKQIEAPPRVDRRILLTTGSHNYQAYWVAGRFGRELYQFPWIYHIGGQRWIPREDAFIEPPDAGRHFAHWNSNCIQCHAVAGKPGLNPERILGNPQVTPQVGELFSEVVEFGIGCEACHGPGKAHVRRHRNPLNRYRQHLSAKTDPTIINPARVGHRVSAEICGQCHSSFKPTDTGHWLVHGHSYRAGEQLEKSHRIHRFDDLANQEQPPLDVQDLYWGDGAVRVGGREFLGLIESPCFQRGQLSCLSCHSMHDSDPDDQLTDPTEENHACLQCHQGYQNDLTRHTHHPADSEGSRCYNCHMPHTSFALLKGIRSHRIDSPSVASSLWSGRPNACNLCHIDQTLQWAAMQLNTWYGLPLPEMDHDQRNVAASLLWLLRGDASQRAIAAWAMGWKPAQQASGNEWMAPFLAQLLNDPYSAVRFGAIRSLRVLPGFESFDFDFLAPESERLRAVTGALTTWNDAVTARPRGERAARLLFNPDGSLNESSIARLKLQRDDRPVVIPE